MTPGDDPFDADDADDEMLSLTLPPTWTRGQDVAVVLSDGLELLVSVPYEAVPGSTVCFRANLSTSITDHMPSNTGPRRVNAFCSTSLAFTRALLPLLPPHAVQQPASAAASGAAVSTTAAPVCPAQPLFRSAIAVPADEVDSDDELAWQRTTAARPQRLPHSQRPPAEAPRRAAANLPPPPAAVHAIANTLFASPPAPPSVPLTSVPVNVPVAGSAALPPLPDMEDESLPDWHFIDS